MDKKYYKQTWFFWELIVLILGLAIKIIFIEHPLESDDTSYMEIAKYYSERTVIFAHNQVPFRSGFLIPLYFLMTIFGYSIFTYYLYSISYSMLLLLAIMLVAKRLFGAKIAFLSGLLYISSYISFYQSTNVLPDIPAFTWALLSFYLFINILSGKSNKYLLLLSSLFGFLAYLCKLPVIVFLIVIPVFEYIKYRSVKNTIFYAIIFIFLWSFESIIYLIVTGDFFIRLKMFSHGVDNWIVYQPSLSFREFLLNCPRKIFSLLSGKFLIITGLIGILLSVKKKNNKIITLIIGGLFIYILYTYSFYSIEPLIPSLPPQFRYIIGFFCILNIVSAWVIYTIYRYIKRLIHYKYINYVFYLIILAFFIFQVKEISKNSNSVFFKKDTYFVANRIMNDKIINSINDTVYALPIKDFILYSNFKKLNLKPLVDLPKTPCYLLYSKEQIRKIIFYAKKRKDQQSLEFMNKVLIHPNSRNIINYDGIILTYISSFDVNYDTVFQLSEFLNMNSFWADNDNILLSIMDNKQTEIKILEDSGTPFYFYTFKSVFNEVPKYDSTLIPYLNPFKIYRLEISLSIEKDLDNFLIFLSECNSIKRINTYRIRSDYKNGEHLLKFDFTASASAKTFKIYFKVKNSNKDNRIIIKDIILFEIK